MTARGEKTTSVRPHAGSGAARVALGIAVSRGFGFLREMVLAYFFGVGPHADVFRTALRGPNLLQNLLGEQSLSASFIPVYSRLLGAGRREDAGRFAGAIFGLLLASASIISLLGVYLAKPIVSILAPGYLADAAAVASGDLTVDRFPLAVAAVRIIFPMTGILVLSAWALGVLNSHRRFLISYMAPALWNAAIIAGLLFCAFSLPRAGSTFSFSGIEASALNDLLLAACLGALVGGALQFAVQLPWALRVMRGFRVSFSTRVEGVRDALRAFLPLLAGRGAVQISGYLDYFLASFLAAGAVAALGWAQTLYLLPISLFGMSVAAAELPELARRTAPADREELEKRVRNGFEKMIFLTIPSCVCFLAFGYLVVGALFRRGRFGAADNWLVYLVLVAYSVGLVASTTSRLMNNVFYALGKTKIPARIAIERVVLSALIGVSLMFWLDRYSVDAIFSVRSAGRDVFLGALGLAIGAGLSSWYELGRIQRALQGAVGPLSLPWLRAGKLCFVALVSVLPAMAIWFVGRGMPREVLAMAVLIVYGVAYFVLAAVLGLGSLGQWLGRSD